MPSAPVLSSVSTRPLFSDFAYAGVPEALVRGLAALRARVPEMPEMPSWLWAADFVQARASADPWSAGALVQALRRAERLLRTRVARRAAHGAWPAERAPPGGTPAIPAWAADGDEAQKRMVVALGRLALGAAVEAVLAEKAVDLFDPAVTPPPGCGQAAGRLYQDAFLVSVWTSAHAQYVSYVQQGIEEPPAPGVFTVPSALSEFDHSDLFARRSCQRQCPKGAMPLLQILCRCTNPGARGCVCLCSRTLQLTDAQPCNLRTRKHLSGPSDPLDGPFLGAESHIRFTLHACLMFRVMLHRFQRSLLARPVGTPCSTRRSRTQCRCAWWSPRQ